MTPEEAKRKFNDLFDEPLSSEALSSSPPIFVLVALVNGISRSLASIKDKHIRDGLMASLEGNFIWAARQSGVSKEQKTFSFSLCRILRESVDQYLRKDADSPRQAKDHYTP